MQKYGEVRVHKKTDNKGMGFLEHYYLLACGNLPSLKIKSFFCNGNISVVKVFGAIVTCLLFGNLANSVSRLNEYFLKRGPVFVNLQNDFNIHIMNLSRIQGAVLISVNRTAQK